VAAPGRPVRSIPLSDGRLEGLGTDVRDIVGPGPARVEVALLPEVCQVRRVSMPPLTRAERRAVLERTLTRHLPGSGPWAFGDEAGAGGALVVAAPLDLVLALQRGLAQPGLRLGAVRAAYQAWLAAADGAATTLVVTANRLELVHATDGRIRSVRRMPRSLTPGDAVAGMSPHVTLDQDPEAMAAAFATRASGPEIVTADAFARRERIARGVVRRLTGIAAGLALLAAGLAWWGTWREVTALRAAREAHAPAVARALAVRERVTRLDERLAALDPSRSTNPAWSRVVADLAEHLPPTAFLTAFRGAGDSVSLEGYAREAGPVLEALRQAPAVAALRATAPIRREGGPGDAAVDRFVLGLRLAPRGTP
jgi:hypothetical protein